MGKRYNIKWRESDIEQLKKERRNMQARANYIKKTHPELASSMPTIPSLDDMVSSIKTRDDFKREVRSMQNFRGSAARNIVEVPNNEYNLKITEWQYKDMLKRQKPINKRRADMREKIQNVEMKSRGEKLGYTYAEAGLSKADDVATKPINVFTKFQNKRDLEKKHKTLRKESSAMFWTDTQMTMKQHLIDGIKANYNGYADENELKDLIKHIEGLDFESYYEVLMTDKDSREFVSPPPGANMDDHMKQNFEGLKAVWMPKKRGS